MSVLGLLGCRVKSALRRNIQIRWLVPIVAVSLVLGALGTLAATGQFTPVADGGAPAPAETPEGPDPLPPRGVIAAARMWFDNPFTSSDSFPLLSELEANGLVSQDVRFALTGANGWDLWVGRTDETLCLLAANAAESDTAVSCVEYRSFAANGIRLSMKNLEAYWDGLRLTTDPPTAIEPTVPPVPEQTPGDVSVANSWFDLPPGPSDEFPYNGNLITRGVDESQVRLAVTQNVPPVKVWVAQQGTTGFCLIATTDPDREGNMSHISCVTLEEFRASGLSIAVPGLAAFWDGNSVSFTR